jgi:hypothetical protein
LITYLVLKCSPAQMPFVQAHALEAVERELTFQPDFSIVHTDAKRGLVCVVKGRHDPLASPRFLFEEDAFIVLNGPAPGFGQGSNSPLIKDVWDTLQRGGPSLVHDTLKGTYNLVAAAGDDLVAFSDFSGLSPVYRSGGAMWAFSNRSTVLSRFRYGTEAWDPLAISWLVGHANIFGPGVPARGVSLVTPGTAAIVRNAECKLAPLGTSVWPSPGDLSLSDLSSAEWDEVTHDLIDGFRTIGQRHDYLRLSITGGKDSRLALALAVAARLGDQIGTFTNGLPESPEVECAAAVAAIAGVRHVRPQPPTEGPEPPFDPSTIWNRLRQHAFRYEGMVCPWDGLCPRQIGTKLEITGFGGELYKGGHAKRFRKAILDSVETAKALWLDYHQPFDPFGLLSEKAAAYQKRYLRGWVETAAHSTRLDALPERFYVENRLTQ